MSIRMTKKQSTMKKLKDVMQLKTHTKTNPMPGLK